MFQDREDALEQLAKQLLEEEEAEETIEEEAESSEEDFENTLLEEEDSHIYPTDPNHYDSYTAYNADRTDASAEDYSDILLEPERRNNSIFWIALLVMILMTAILGILAWLYLGGMLL